MDITVAMMISMFYVVACVVEVLAFPANSDARIEHKECYGKDISVAHMAFGLWSFEECLTECQHRNVCVGIRYHPPSKHCSVLDGLVLDALENVNNKCLFVNISVWDASPVAACVDHSCSSNEKCKPSDEDPNTPVCETSECPSAPEVQFAHHLSDTRTIGTTNRYICDAGYSLVGIPDVICQDNGVWTAPNFTCVKQCLRPKDFYNNADLIGYTSVSNFGPGTSLSFECKDGFRKAHLYTSNVCNSDSQWSHHHMVHCCPDHLYYDPVRRWCTQPFSQGEADTVSGNMHSI